MKRFYQFVEGKGITASYAGQLLKRTDSNLKKRSLSSKER
jgi:hypothetical protein